MNPCVITAGRGVAEMRDQRLVALEVAGGREDGGAWRRRRALLAPTSEVRASCQAVAIPCASRKRGAEAGGQQLAEAPSPALECGARLAQERGGEGDWRSSSKSARAARRRQSPSPLASSRWRSRSPPAAPRAAAQGGGEQRFELVGDPGERGSRRQRLQRLAPAARATRRRCCPVLRGGDAGAAELEHDPRCDRLCHGRLRARVERAVAARLKIVVERVLEILLELTIGEDFFELAPRRFATLGRPAAGAPACPPLAAGGHSQCCLRSRPGTHHRGRSFRCLSQTFAKV